MNYSRRQLEALGEPLGDCVTRKEDGRIIYGGGGSSAPSSSTQVTDLPDWAKPKAQETLERADALSKAPYQTYDQPRTAGFSPMQERAQESAFNMGPSSQISAGTGLAAAAGMMGLGANYQPGYFGNQFRAPQQYQPSQFDMMSAQAPDLQQYQMDPAERVYGGNYDAPMMGAAQTDFNPNLQQFQMGPAERAETQSFTQPGSAEAYMSPFMQNVVDKQTREAERQAGLAAKQERAQSIQRGSFGGGRTAVREAAAARDLAQLKSDIYGTGQQASFQNAQQQFNAEQQARMQAQLANQQAGLTVGGQNLGAKLGVQQLGAQTGMQTALANLNNRQQAEVANQASRLQTQGLNANQAMQAALANQQAGLTTGQQNLNALLGVQQLGSGQNMQAQLANQQAYQNMLQQREGSRQFGAGQGMTAAQLRAQYGLSGQQLGEQSRQFGAGYGQQGINTALQAAGQLGNLGQAEFGQNKDIIGLQSQLGGQQQAQRQQDLTMAYQDYLNEKNEPYRQLGFMSDMIRGLPLGQQTTRQVYEAPGSALGQIAGLGVGLGGMSRFGQMFPGGASGGEVKEYADGGSVTSDYKVDNILENLSDAQLQQARMAALNGKDQRRLQMIDEEMAERASLRSGLGSAFNTLPEETQESVTEMASGGIVAFAGPTEDNNYSLVQDPQFGAGLSAEALSGDRARVEALKARRAAEEERKRLEFLRTAAPEVYERRMAERPAAPVASRQEPARTAPSAPPRQEIKLPPARPSRSESSSTVTRQNATEAVQTIANAAKIEIPKDETRTLSKTLFDELMSKSDEERKEFKAELQNAKNRAKEIEARGIGEAMMKFGFGMAAAASKPGRRQGLAGVLESAAAASPLLSESMAENTKLQQAAQDNYTKLRMENSRYQSALEQGNMQLAANIAAGISQRKLTEADLQQKIAQSDRTANLEQQKLGLEERKLAVMRSQASQKTAIQKIADDLQSADPKLDRTAALNEASRISGYSFKGSDAAGGKLQAALSKIEDDYKMLPALLASNPDGKLAQQMAADRQRRRDEAMRLYGGQQQTGVGSSGASQVYRFDSKGNPIQ